mmetsp:Transcript_13781/g.39008  ORF Transcript_13781/g.39008 Transcript_13781/m.39008 type:complete len:248 (+) Transcript_13781:443-1186(+)
MPPSRSSTAPCSRPARRRTLRSCLSCMTRRLTGKTPHSSALPPTALCSPPLAPCSPFFPTAPPATSCCCCRSRSSSTWTGAGSSSHSCARPPPRFSLSTKSQSTHGPPLALKPGRLQERSLRRAAGRHCKRRATSTNTTSGGPSAARRSRSWSTRYCLCMTGSSWTSAAWQTAATSLPASRSSLPQPPPAVQPVGRWPRCCSPSCSPSTSSLRRYPHKSLPASRKCWAERHCHCSRCQCAATACSCW